MRFLSTGERKLAAELAKNELAGVGRIPSLLERLEVAIHYRRVLTAAEIQELDATWCAMPAFDDAGHGIELERDT
jgi:hypothetical protein